MGDAPAIATTATAVIAKTTRPSRQLIHLQFDSNGSPCARPLDDALDESLANPGASASRLDPHTAEVGSLRWVVQEAEGHPDEFVVVGCLDEPDTAVAG